MFRPIVTFAISPYTGTERVVVPVEAEPLAVFGFVLNFHYHYHGNAETYMLVGEAMGKAILEIKK